jgi:predicted ATPase
VKQNLAEWAAAGTDLAHREVNRQLVRILAITGSIVTRTPDGAAHPGQQAPVTGGSMDSLSVAWRNFRGFERETSFEFPAISLFIGRNNVGKSSAYAPLLLLRQTLNATDPRTAILSRGELLDVGSYKDYVSRHQVERNITFALDIPTSSEMPRYGSRIQPHRLEVTFDSSDGNVARLYRHSIYDDSGRPIVTRTRERNSDAFAVTSRLLPVARSVGRPLKEVTELRSGMREEQPTGYLFNGYGGLILPRRWRENEERWSKVRDWYNGASELVDIYQWSNYSLTQWLQQIAYIGPLRSLPQRTYRLAAEPPNTVGREGQHAPELLFRGRDDELRARTDDWLERLGYGSLEFEDLGEDYFQVFIKMAGGLRVNIAHSGVGLSQLLPLLVQGLSTPERALLIAQQPEIHLNPAQQSILTDFLVELGASGRRVLVETHSEHVLLRLRRRIAEGLIDAKDVAVYYFDYRAGRVRVERMPIADDGAISREAWPSGFFEEQLTDSFAMALAQSRRATR